MIDTPRTIISDMGKARSPKWDCAWRNFYEIYYKVIERMTRNFFTRIKWTHLKREDLEEIISNILESIIKDFGSKKYHSENHHFRGYLAKIVKARCVDFIRKDNRKSTIPKVLFDMIYEEQIPDAPANVPLANLEFKDATLYRQRVLLEVWECARMELSPQVCMVFEYVKLRGNSPEMAMKEMGINRNTVDRSIFKAMRKIKEHIIEKGYRKELEQ